VTTLIKQNRLCNGVCATVHYVGGIDTVESAGIFAALVWPFLPQGLHFAKILGQLAQRWPQRKKTEGRVDKPAIPTKQAAPKLVVGDVAVQRKAGD